jgi:putative oxidoreductase
MLDFFRPSSKTAYVDLGIFILRVFVFLLLIPHGYDKLLNFLDGAADFPDPLHVGAPFSHFLAVVGEVAAPILLILGLLTRFASVVEIIHFLVVAFMMHANEPLDAKEHALLYLIPSVMLLLTGAGKYSLDSLLFQQKRY